jgi:hypothetical protein
MYGFHRLLRDPCCIVTSMAFLLLLFQYMVLLLFSIVIPFGVAAVLKAVHCSETSRASDGPREGSPSRAARLLIRKLRAF